MHAMQCHRDGCHCRLEPPVSLFATDLGDSGVLELLEFLILESSNSLKLGQQTDDTVVQIRLIHSQHWEQRI